MTLAVHDRDIIASTPDRADDRGLGVPWLLFAAILVQLTPGAPFAPPGAAFRHLTLYTGHALVAAWLVTRLRRVSGLRRAGLVVAAAGWMMNLAVMLPNGWMPVSAGALHAVGGEGIDVRDGYFYEHVPVTTATVLEPLADIHPVAPLRMVISAGDVALAAGIVLVVAGSITPRDVSTPGRRRRRRRRRRGRWRATRRPSADTSP